MEMVAQPPLLNKAQTLLLQAFTGASSEREKDDIQALLLDYYRKRVDAHIGSVAWSSDRIQEALAAHDRTPYK
jgi:hypothetical protein